MTQPTTKKKIKMHAVADEAEKVGPDQQGEREEEGREHVRGELLDGQNQQEAHEWSESTDEFLERASGCCRSHCAQEKKELGHRLIGEVDPEELRYRGGETNCRLTVHQDALAPCADKSSDWTQISLAADSGACESVIRAVVLPITSFPQTLRTCF